MQTTTAPSAEPPWPDENIFTSGGGTSLVFDKYALESLSIHEAAILDHFYRCTITPLFYVECLADLENLCAAKASQSSLSDRLPSEHRNGIQLPTCTI
jgi:hypothetical protein